MASFNFGGMMQGLGAGLATVGKQQQDLLVRKQEQDWRSKEAELMHQRNLNIEELRAKRQIEAEERADTRAQAAEVRAEGRFGRQLQMQQEAASAAEDVAYSKAKERFQDQWTELFEGGEYEKMDTGSQSFLNLYRNAGVSPADALKQMAEVRKAASKAGKDMKSATEAHLKQGEDWVTSLEEQQGFQYEPTVRAEMVARWGTKLANPGLDLWDMTKQLKPEEVDEYADLILKGEAGGDMMLLTPESRNKVLAKLKELSAGRSREARKAGYQAGARTTVKDAGSQAAEKTRGMLKRTEFGSIY